MLFSLRMIGPATQCTKAIKCKQNNVHYKPSAEDLRKYEEINISYSFFTNPSSERRISLTVESDVYSMQP